MRNRMYGVANMILATNPGFILAGATIAVVVVTSIIIGGL